MTIRPGRDIQRIIDARPEGTTFCFKSKIYRLGGPLFPKSRDVFIGRYGAVLDGGRWETSDTSLGAFTGTARSVTDVTIRNLVIRNMPQSGIATAFAANSRWTIDHNEVSRSFIGISFPDHSTITSNLIHDNAKYGFTGYRTSGSVFKNNEVSYNYTCLCYPADGGASKLVGTSNDSIVGNYIHDNGGNAIWFDTDNTGVLIKGNTVTVNERYGKAVSMEQNNGLAIIRNNAIRVGSGAEVGILVNNSSNQQIHGNTVTTASTSSGGAIHVFFDASRTGYDTMNNSVHDNTVRLRGSATTAASVSCINVADCSPYWTSKGNTFEGNAYLVPNRAAAAWTLGAPVTWTEWQAAGFDTSGNIIS